jgi:hypothetical protein
MDEMERQRNRQRGERRQKTALDETDLHHSLSKT